MRAQNKEPDGVIVAADDFPSNADLVHPEEAPEATPVRRCKKCGIEKPLDDFYRDRNRHLWACKICVTAQTGKWRAANLERVAFLAWRAQIRRRYGMTPEDFDELVEAQGDRCAICGTDEPAGAGRWHIDHDHETGVVRGLLCWPCNSKLAILENVEWVDRAMAYLRRSKVRRAS